MANEGLEKAIAYLNQVPRDRWLYIPSEGCGVNFRWKHLQTTPTHYFWAELSSLLGEKKSAVPLNIDEKEVAFVVSNLVVKTLPGPKL